MGKRFVNHIGVNAPNQHPDLNSTPAVISTLFGLLETETLHPMFHDSLPDRSPVWEFPESDYAKARVGMVHYLGNFWTLSCAFNIDTDDEEQINYLDALIAANRATAKYQDAVKEWFEIEKYWRGDSTLEKVKRSGIYSVATENPVTNRYMISGQSSRES